MPFLYGGFHQIVDTLQGFLCPFYETAIFVDVHENGNSIFELYTYCTE